MEGWAFKLVLIISVIILLYVLFLVVRHVMLKRMLLEEDQEPIDMGPAFSLPEIKKLHKEGLISREEYDKLKEIVIQEMQKSE